MQVIPELLNSLLNSKWEGVCQNNVERVLAKGNFEVMVWYI